MQQNAVSGYLAKQSRRKTEKFFHSDRIDRSLVGGSSFAHFTSLDHCKRGAAARGAGVARGSRHNGGHDP